MAEPSREAGIGVARHPRVTGPNSPFDPFRTAATHAKLPVGRRGRGAAGAVGGREERCDGAGNG